MFKKDILLRSLVLFSFILIIVGIFYFAIKNEPKVSKQNQKNASAKDTNPLSIEAMRNRDYPGSNLVIEETLLPGSNYNQYIASYESEGLKIYGLLTVPTDEEPTGGFPAIIFNHGYIPPEEYKTTERYVAYVDGFARSGFVVFKPDYRGHGNSQGEPTGAYFSPGYTVDVLNAVSSVRKLPYVNPKRIGMWGHSMGGFLTERAMVIRPSDIKAAVVWSGVVGSYEDIYKDWWNKRSNFAPFRPSSREQEIHRTSSRNFTAIHGQPTMENAFWKSIDPISFISDAKAPVQLHQSKTDEEIPYSLSQHFYDELKAAGKKTELYFYENDDHNLSQSFDLSMQRSIDFFEVNLK